MDKNPHSTFKIREKEKEKKNWEIHIWVAVCTQTSVFFFPRDKFFCARDTARKKLPVTLLHTRDTTVKCYPWHPWQTVVNPTRDTRDKTKNANSELLDFFKVF